MTQPTPPSNASMTTAVPDLRTVFNLMKKAQRAHPSPGHDERIRSLDRLEEALLVRQAAIATAISRDFGNRSSHETLVGEVLIVLGAIRHAKEHLREWMEPDERAVNWLYLPSTAQVVAQPVGVVGIMAPWNYPVQLSLSPLVSALAAGNRAMVKTSELAPATGALLADLLAETYQEDEVIAVGGGPEVGELFSRLPFDHLLFTGSTRVGKLVMRAASENLVPVTLELGGKSPAIVGPDASIRAAAMRIMTGKLFSAGQTCIAPDYALVPAALRDAFVEACSAAASTLYPKLAQNPDYTSIINDAALARLQRYLEDARSRGARVVSLQVAGESLDGTRKLAPTLVLDVDDEMLLSREEIFGPILPIVSYTSLDDAIEYVNDRPRPLALYYFGRDRKSIDRVLSQTVTGGVTINETLLHLVQDDLPFGGIGPSGMGHYHGREGFETFSKKKPVFQQARVGARSLLRPPFGKMADGILRMLLR